MAKEPVSWNDLANIFCEPFDRDVTDKITSGPLRLPNGDSFYVMVYFHSNGIRIGKRFRPLLWRKLWIDWDLIAAVNALPSSAPKHLSAHTDANITLHNDSVSRLTVPWRLDFEPNR